MLLVNNPLWYSNSSDLDSYIYGGIGRMHIVLDCIVDCNV